jgi:hypothetical protein
VGIGKVKNPDVGAILDIAVNGPGRIMEKAGQLAEVIDAANRCRRRPRHIDVLKPEVAGRNLGDHARYASKRSHSKSKYG